MRQEEQLEDFTYDEEDDLNVQDLLSKAISTIDDTSNVSIGFRCIRGWGAQRLIFKLQFILVNRSHIFYTFV